MNTECPNCAMESAYFDGVIYVCPDCDHEWGGISEEDDSQLECPECNSERIYLNDTDEGCYICIDCGTIFDVDEDDDDWDDDY